MLAADADILFLDFETTGSVRGHDNLPWQLGAIRMLDLELRPSEAFSLLLRVPETHPFNPYAPGRWASIRERLGASPTLVSLWPQLAPWLTGRALVAHNTPTERSILRSHFPLHRFGPWLDTLAMARCAYPGLESHKLEDLIPELGLQGRLEGLAPGLQPHDAFYDACASAVLFRHILMQPGWHHATVEALERLSPSVPQRR